MFEEKKEEFKEKINFTPIIIFVTIRLGLNKIDIKEQPYIFKFFDIPHNCGILGKIYAIFLYIYISLIFRWFSTKSLFLHRISR